MKKLGQDNLFNPSLLEELNIINLSKLFIYGPSYDELHTLACTVSGRLFSAINYLNNHKRYPKSEDEFILFMVYSCTIVDGIKKLLNKIFKEDFDKNEKKYFLKLQQGEFFPVEECDYLSDDKMFEYLRALIFAHPFHIDRHLKKYFSEQISPWLSMERTWTVFSKKTKKDSIGIQVFAKRKKDDGKDSMFLDLSFKDLKEYVNSRYVYLEKAIQWFKDEQLKVETEWKEKKINRNLDPISLIEEIDKLLIERHMGVHGLKQLCFYLACPCTEKLNEVIVNKYRDSLINKLSEMCDAVDNLDKKKLSLSSLI